MPTRRAFLIGAASLAVAPLAAQTFDLVIADGRVLDPESGLDAVRNIGISGGRVAAVTADRITGRTTIDASGLVVSPGFIDVHAHGQTPETYRFQARDGVTSSFELELGTGTVDAWYSARATSLINHGVSIGHIPVRMAVMRDPGPQWPTGDAAHRAATPAEIAQIAQRIEQGLKQGAVSIGAGFAYTPAATDEELIEVFRVAARNRVTLHVHIRRGIAGLQQALGFAAQTKAPLHVVHINSAGGAATREMLQAIADARARGVDVTTEAYPYDAGMTEIQSANLDEYANATADRVAQLEWPRTGERLTPETFKKYRQAGGPVVLHNNTEAMVAIAINSPLTMIASDSYWENGTGHPRTTGTYSKVLGRFVRDARSLTLMDAIRKMTLMPAQRLEPRVAAMKTKGRLRVGADADITVFDAARVIDRSTYRQPSLPPVGIRHVIVNGVAVVRDERLVDSVAPGRGIRA
jgi:N-acyl-D-aspartate/D-glutamate deacylase